MRFILFLALFLSAAALPAAAQDEFEGVNVDEFSERNPDQPPPLDEYKTVPENMMIPAAQVPGAEGGPVVGIHSSSGKLNYETLMKLYKQGKFEQVAKDLEPLAKGGHRGAQELMGIMLRQGQGIEKNPQKAFEYLSEAANANRPLAQHHLGSMYYQGDGAPADSIMALMWIQIALVHYAEGPDKNRALQDRDSMYTHLSRREKDRAMQLARDWLTKRGEGHLLDLQ